MTRDKASTSAQAKREKLYKVKRKSQIQNLDKCTRVRCGTTWLSHTVGFIRPVRVKFMKLYRIHIPRENYPLSAHKLPLLRGKRGKNNHCQYISSPLRCSFTSEHLVTLFREREISSAYFVRKAYHQLFYTPSVFLFFQLSRSTVTWIFMSKSFFVVEFKGLPKAQVSLLKFQERILKFHRDSILNSTNKNSINFRKEKEKALKELLPKFYSVTHVRCCSIRI